MCKLSISFKQQLTLTVVVNRINLNKIAEINKTQTEQINTIFNGLIKTN